MSAAASASPTPRTPRGSRSRTVMLDREAEEKSGAFGARIRDAEARHRHRHDLLHAGEREASGRGAARQGPALPALPARSGCTARASPCRPPRCSRASPSANTGSRRRRSRPICSTRRGGTAFPATIVHPGHIVGPGWTRSTRPATSTRGLHHARQRRGTGAAEFRPGDGASRPCRRRRAGVHAGDRQLERLGRRGLPRRLAAGGDAPRLCRGDVGLVRPGAEARLPALAGMEGARRRARRKRRRPGSTSPAARARSIAKAERLLGYGRATPRSRRCRGGRVAGREGRRPAPSSWTFLKLKMLGAAQIEERPTPWTNSADSRSC